MKFQKFIIKNYKGIESIEIDLNKSPETNIFTLLGLNESGKTTILEAINLFNPKDEVPRELEQYVTGPKDFNNLIPISKRANFNGRIEIIVQLRLENGDMKKISDFAKKKTSFKSLRNKKSGDTIEYFRYYEFKNSNYVKSYYQWSGFEGELKEGDIKGFVDLNSDDKYREDNNKLLDHCQTFIPSILYFPNFLFDFPTRIYLDLKNPSEKENFYCELIQDILFSLNNNTNIKDHIIKRAKSGQRNDKRNLDALLKKMNHKVSDNVFKAWDEIFKRKITDTRVNINCEVDEAGKTFLEFRIEAGDGIYQINERSLGFRWFFTFLLFTQFRPFRRNSPKNVIFLFDEPASNLHSSAQQQLLKSFEKLMKNCQIIYTTHSHHLINPHWLENTYVVKNEGFNLDDPENFNSKETNVNITPYRTFAGQHKSNSAYFQPVLDVLDYTPSKLENIPPCIFVEGKGDYYILEYFNVILFKKRHDLNFAPSTGSGNLKKMISLYIGWNRPFIVFLDSDNAGQKEKLNYFKDYGKFIEPLIHTIEDVESRWSKHALEKLFENDDKTKFQQLSYPNTSYNKTHFHRTIQEQLVRKKPYPNFEKDTEKNFSKVLQYLSDELHLAKKNWFQ